MNLGKEYILSKANKSKFMNNHQLFFQKHKSVVVLLLSIVYLMLLLVWVPGLGATIMMSDSFVINDPRTNFVASMILIWATIPLTIITSIVLLVYKRNIVAYFFPLIHLSIIILMFVFYLMFATDSNSEQNLTNEERHDLDLIMGR